jgi:hypothetical protein
MQNISVFENGMDNMIHVPILRHQNNEELKIHYNPFFLFTPTISSSLFAIEKRTP